MSLSPRSGTVRFADEGSHGEVRTRGENGVGLEKKSGQERDDLVPQGADEANERVLWSHARFSGQQKRRRSGHSKATVDPGGGMAAPAPTNQVHKRRDFYDFVELLAVPIHVSTNVRALTHHRLFVKCIYVYIGACMFQCRAVPGLATSCHAASRQGCMLGQHYAEATADVGDDTDDDGGGGDAHVDEADEDEDEQ